MAGEDLSAKPALVAINGPMCDDYRGKVVYRVLARLGQAPGELQRRFRSIVRGVSINGFRDPNDAPPALLQKHAKKIMLRSDEFVGIVLRIWVDSHAELKEVVVGHLAGRNMPTDGLDLSENRFAGSWNSEGWVRERKKLVAAHSQFCEDDVALMLCCVTGRMPLPSGDDIHADEPAYEMQEAFFSQWIDHLKALPAAAPQWEQAPDFIASITEILKEKEDERNRAEALNTAFAQFREEFADGTGLLPMGCQFVVRRASATPAAGRSGSGDRFRDNRAAASDRGTTILTDRLSNGSPDRACRK